MILVAIGANLAGADGSPPIETCRRSLAALTGAGVRVEAVSRWWRTAPVGDPDQPWFVNGAARVASGLGPEALLAALHRVEARFGRIRSRPGGPRTLDLDLLDYHGARRAGPPGPILPHPRLHERRFVLGPLAEVAPGWRHPVLGLTAGEMLARLATDPVAEPIG